MSLETSVAVSSTSVKGKAARVLSLLCSRDAQRRALQSLASERFRAGRYVGVA